MRKFVSILMAVMMILAMMACGKAAEKDSGAVEGSDKAEESGIVEDCNAVAGADNGNAPNATDGSGKGDGSAAADGSSGENNEPEEIAAENAKAEETSTSKPAETKKPTESAKPAETGKPAETSKPSHTHSWKEVYKTVKHEATPDEYKEEQKLTGYKVTNDCAKFVDGHVIDPYDYNYGSGYVSAINAYQDKLNAEGIASNYGNGAYATHTVSVDTYKAHSDLFYDAQEVYETTKTLVKEGKPAWEEQVLDHYECSCGATK